MSSFVIAASGGRFRPRFMWLVLLAIFMAALHLGRTRADPKADKTGHRERGRSYEAHVLAAERLPAEIRGQGGVLQAHPVIEAARIEVDAQYHASPKGHRGGAQVDAAPHSSALARWPAAGRGGIRIPDAIATWPDGRQVLFELKCPSPWLTFGGGLPWAAKMQAAFGSQALAFLAWAGEAQERRQVVYGFCGEVPPWMAAILRDLSQRVGVSIRVRRALHAQGFPMASALTGRALREAMVLAATELQALVPEDLFGPTFDRLED